jgi:hypothetical protein
MTEHQPSNRTSTALVPVQGHQISAAKHTKRVLEPPFAGLKKTEAANRPLCQQKKNEAENRPSAAPENRIKKTGR